MRKATVRSIERRLKEEYPDFSFRYEASSGFREDSIDFSVFKGDTRLGLMKISEELSEDTAALIRMLARSSALSHLNPQKPITITSRGIS